MKLSRIALAFLLPVIHSSAATLIHDYQFQNNLADSFGGPSLVSLGGTVGSGTYTFGAQQGLSLSNALLNSADYSLFMNFEFSSASGYEKIVDFKNLTSDNGLYNLSAALISTRRQPLDSRTQCPLEHLSTSRLPGMQRQAWCSGT
jgi:hypothetical protein